MRTSFTQDELSYIAVDKLSCKKYKESPDRKDPFNLDLLLYSIQNRVYSKFLRTEINSLHDACEHAKHQIRAWCKEDKAELRKEQNKRYQERKKQLLVETNPELISAKNKWQEAIAQRKSALAQWDEYVLNCQQAYLALKLKGINRV